MFQKKGKTNKKFLCPCEGCGKFFLDTQKGLGKMKAHLKKEHKDFFDALNNSIFQKQMFL